MKLPPKCRRCVKGHTCRIYVGDGSYDVTYCAICRHPMSELELMQRPIALVQP